MRSSSRLALVFALSLGAAACFDRDIAAPPAGGGGGAAVFRPDPITLNAQFVSNHDYVVISWQLSGDLVNQDALSFIVERASDMKGEWVELTRTHAMSIGDNVTLEQRCYRVSARLGTEGSDVDAGRSAPLCVSSGKIYR